MNIFEAVICTLALTLVAGACLARVKAMGRNARICERLGYAVTFGGSIGSALEWWWPRVEVMHGDTVFAVGCGVIAFSVIIRHTSMRIAKARGLWDGNERRRVPRDPLLGG